MRTFLFRDRWALDALVLAERPDPPPGPRQLLLRMRAASLNFRDLAIARGEYGRYDLPRVPLSDGAGEVVAVGPGVERFAIGDLVCPTYVPDWLAGPIREETAARRLGGPVDGVLAELVLVHDEAAVRAPAHLDAREAATLPIAAVTAWQVLFEDGGLRAGDTVAVQGSGGVSLFAVQLARAAGVRVISLVRGPDRRAALEQMGALVVDVTAPQDQDWAARVRQASGERGADLFVDVVGGPGLDRSVDATRVGGTVALVGFVGGATASLDLIKVIRRAVTLRPVSGGSRASFEHLVEFLERHQLRPVIDRVFPFAEARAAYHHLASGRPFGKVVVDIADGGRS